MAISMHSASVPIFVRMLGNMTTWLDKAEAHASAKKFEPQVYLQARLAPDMLPFVNQIQIACDAAKGAAARLAGVAIPAFEDDEKTIADLKARIDKTVAFLRTMKAEQIDGSEEKDLVIKVGGNDTHTKGMSFLLGRSIPNFYFHVTTAYDILRQAGLELGKLDYLGRT